jgi:hypothetical protein
MFKSGRDLRGTRQLSSSNRGRTSGPCVVRSTAGTGLPSYRSLTALSSQRTTRLLFAFQID